MARVGQKFVEHRFTVERGKIKEFVQVIGDDNAIYRDRDTAWAAGYKDVIAPPTFLTLMDNWAGPDFETRCRELEIDPLKVLHGEQGYEYFMEIYPGDELTAAVEVTDVYEKEGSSGRMVFIVMTKEYKRDGQPVAICHSTTVVRE